MLSPSGLLCLVTAPLHVTGTVKLRLTDEMSRPVAAHEIWLAPTNSTKPVRPFGIQWQVPQGAGTYCGLTDNSGEVSIKGVPTGRPMMVITKFGPRFDEFVGESRPGGGSFDVMKFEGAVYTGRTSHITLSQSREILGRVVDGSGQPLSGVDVELTDTGFGHMGGYPGTTLDIQRTDTDGHYRFTNLPNCHFLIMPKAESHAAIDSRMGEGAWRFLGIVDQRWSSQSILLNRRVTTADFRVQPTGLVSVTFKGAKAELKGWTAWAARGSNDLTGRDLGYDESASSFTCYCPPGQLTIWLSREGSDYRQLAGRFWVTAGERKTVRISIAEALNRKTNKSN